MNNSNKLYEGHIDHVENGVISGWAWRQDLPDEAVSVDLYVDDKKINSTTCATYRADLEKAKRGNGRHSFQIRLPDRYRDGDRHLINLCYHETSIALYGSPRLVCLERKTGPAYRINSTDERAQLDARVRQSAGKKPRNRPKVSVIIPCYNLGEYVDEAVDSVFEQTYQDFEIVIVNDGSTDPLTNQLLANYARPKTRVLWTQNRGLPSARNHAIEQSTGEYICALDADDKLASSYLEKTVKTLETSDTVSFVSCWLQTFGDEDWVWKQDHCDLITLLGECTVCTAALVRRTALERSGLYDSQFRDGHEDWDLWISLVEKGLRGVIIPEILFYYRRRNGSMSTICTQGEIQVKLLRLLIAKHEASYREKFFDVLFRKEIDCSGLLRANSDLERNMEGLADMVRLKKAELDRLRSLDENSIRAQECLARGVERECLIDDHERYQQFAHSEGEKLHQEKQAVDFELSVQKENVSRLETERDRLMQQLASVESESVQSQECCIGLENTVERLRREIVVLRNSRSWKVTAPLRRINAIIYSYYKSLA